MKKFFVWILAIGVIVGAVYFFAPDRIRDQMTATAGFLGSSLGRVFTVATDTAGNTKKFVVEKAEEVVNPKSPRERREELLGKLETNVAKIENPQTSIHEKQKLASQSKEIITQIKENNEDDRGFIDSIVGAIKGGGEMCKPEE